MSVRACVALVVFAVSSGVLTGAWLVGYWNVPAYLLVFGSAGVEWIICVASLIRWGFGRDRSGWR